VAVAEPPPLPPKARPAPDDTPLPVARPLTWRDRLVAHLGTVLFAPLVAAVGLVPYALVVNGTGQFADWPHLWSHLLRMFFVTAGLSWAVLLGAGSAGYRASDTWWRRLGLGTLGLMVGGLAYWLDGRVPFQPAGGAIDPGLFAVLYFGGVLAAGRWWRAVARDRKERFSLFPVFAAGFWGTVLLVLKFFWPENTGSVAEGLVPVVLTMIAVQAVSPWTPPAPVNQPKKLRLRGA
jgi:hypothetical protein